MELLSVAQVLRRRRILVAVGLVLALLLGAAVSGILPLHKGARAQSSAQALVRVLIDTRVPLVATVTPDGTDTITQRSVLLASDMGSDTWTATIAHAAGIPSNRLLIVSPTFPAVTVSTLMPAGQFPQLTATAAQTDVVEPYVVRLAPDLGDPIITIGTAAPTTRQAAALANGTVAALKSVTARPGGARGNANVESLGSVHVGTVTSTARTHHLLGLLVVIAVAAIWCSGIVVCSGFARAWRQAGGRTSSAAS
jgi:hypothetical protein